MRFHYADNPFCISDIQVLCITRDPRGDFQHLQVNVVKRELRVIRQHNFRRRKGADLEQVTVDCPFLLQAVANFANQGWSGPLVARSSTAFRASFDSALKDMRLDSYGLKPYSLRRGGACFDFATQGDIAKTVWRGRWQQLATGRTYIQSGRYALQKVQTSPSQEEAFDRYAELVKAALVLCT